MLEVKKQSKLKKSMIGVIALAVCFVVALGICVFLQFTKPYAITVGGNDVVYVDSGEIAKDVVRTIMKDYTADHVKVTSVLVDDEIKTEKVNFWESYDAAKVMDKKQAINYLKKKNASDDPAFKVTISGTNRVKEEYTPETVYKKDDELFAGEKRVEEGTGSGTQYVTRKYTTENGELTATEITDTEVIEEAKPEVVYKGVRGLPEGEDWKTYEGDPLITNGEDLVEYAKRFLGNPYVLGGKSLTHGCDCVGFVQGMYKFTGRKLPDTLGSVGRRVSASSMKPGDIIVFYPHHVALYYGDGKVIHAASPKLDICMGHYGGKIKQVRRVF